MGTVEQVVIGVIWRRDMILVTQRRKGGSYPLYWEFPGGKQEPGESPLDGLKREIKEELGIHVLPIGALESLIFPDVKGWRVIRPYECLALKDPPHALGCRTFRWIQPKDLKKYKFPPANRPLIQWLVKHDRNLRYSRNSPLERK